MEMEMEGRAEELEGLKREEAMRGGRIRRAESNPLLLFCFSVTAMLLVCP
jgi:hypothetical protein